MKKLELKIPPVIQGLLYAVLIFLTQKNIPGVEAFPVIKLVLGAIFFAGGLFIALLGVYEFRKFQTTVDPRDPNKTGSIVCSGVYCYTRNPMYLGMLLCLISLCIYWGSSISLIYCGLFIFTMTFLQIKPEERILTSKFSDEYLAYRNRVHRWI